MAESSYFLSAEVVQAVIDDVVRSGAEGTVVYYKNLPNPGSNLLQQRISSALNKLGPEAEPVVRDVIDRTVYSLLYLIDSNFKEKNIQTVFRDAVGSPRLLNEDGGLTDVYRSRVDPGGLIAE